MSRALVLFVLTLAVTVSATAQTQRPIVGTAPFFHMPAVPSETATQLEAMVTEALFTSDRFELVEVERLDAISQELYEQGDERYMEGVVTAVAPMGAQYLLLGTLADVSVNADAAEGVRTYSATVDYHLRKVSVGTRKVECHARVRSGAAEKAKSALRETATSVLGGRLGGLGGRAASKTIGADTPDAAITAALEDTKPQVEDFIASCFPQTFEILAVEREDAAGHAEEVLVAGSSEATGLAPGATLHVVEQQRFELSDGTIRVREVPVATLTVREIQGGGFALCTVGAAHREALAEALSAADALVVVADD